MSQLRIRTKGYDEIKLNVESFMSPIFAATNSSQTQAAEQHHPIRCQQPNIRFDVIFASEKEWEEWQIFVRSIQLKLLKGKDPNDVAVVTLWWPERDIKNWQGLIKATNGGAIKWNWTPREVVEVELVKGFVATRAALWSFGTDFDAIFGGTINTIPRADVLFSPPTSINEPTLVADENVDEYADRYMESLLGTEPGIGNSPGGTVDSIFGAGR